MFIKPIHPGTFYYRNLFGTILYDSTSDCLDICLSKSFSRLPEANKHSFQVLSVPTPFTFGDKIIESDYAKDNNTVFYRNNIITQADANSFSALGLHLGKDASQYYLYNIPLDVYLKKIDSAYEFNSQTLEVISYDPSKYLLIVKNESQYYYVKLNPLPMSIRVITQEEASHYNRLN